MPQIRSEVRADAVPADPPAADASLRPTRYRRCCGSGGSARRNAAADPAAAVQRSGDTRRPTAALRRRQPTPPAPRRLQRRTAARRPARQVAVGQKAIFYEERTNVAEGSAEPGNVVWTLVQESPGDGQPAEAAIHGEATIPGKDIELRMTIRRNADKTLPASHIIELIFLTPESFDGGGIDKVLRFALKDTEEDPGNAAARHSADQGRRRLFPGGAQRHQGRDRDQPGRCCRREQWIDVPVVYENGRRALITHGKGHSRRQGVRRGDQGLAEHDVGLSRRLTGTKNAASRAAFFVVG